MCFANSADQLRISAILDRLEESEKEWIAAKIKLEHDLREALEVLNDLKESKQV